MAKVPQQQYIWPFVGRMGKKELYADSYADLKFEATKFANKHPKRRVDKLFVTVVDRVPLAVPMMIQRVNQYDGDKFVSYGNWF